MALKPFVAQPEPASPWLVFSSGGKLESDFVEELRKTHNDVIVALAGPESCAFQRLGSQEFRIDPANAGHYKKLFATSPGSGPGNFVHFWSLTDGVVTPEADSIHRAFHSLFCLAQAAGEESTSEQKNIWVVSNGLADVMQNDLPNPDKAILLGPCRTIPFEYPNLHCGLIDIGMPGHDTAGVLLRCCANPPRSLFTAYRMERFWCQCLEPWPLPASGGSSRLREGGVYFITGGLGVTGLTLALHLAKKVKAKLILLDRATPPARADWDHLLSTESTPAAVRLQINTLRGLEELSAPLLIAQADVCEEPHLREIAAKAIERFGAIHGVIHAAGTPGGGIMQFKTPAELEAVLAPKVRGARILESVFKDLDLDFFAACSSVTSVQGEFAQADNCAANAFLDAFCLNNSLKPSARTIAIGWDAWKEAGSAHSGALSADLDPLRSQQMAAALSTEDAVEVFDRILNLDAPRLHVLVSTLNLDLSRRRSNVTPQLSGDGTSIAAPALHSRPELSTIFVAPRDETERRIAEVWQSVLGIEPIGASDDFWELGGHSLLATQIVTRLKTALAIEVPLNALFQAPTVAKLAKYVSAMGHQERQPSSQILVNIQPQGSRTPFFCVHPVGGQVISYAQLSQELGLEQPFYGLQSPPREFFPESSPSIEQMAALYNQEIRSLQPSGPYLLSGWSMGGLVAWEMAQQLIKDGETVGLLALIDTPPPSLYREAIEGSGEIPVLAQFALDMSRLVGRDPRPLAEQFSQAAAQDQWNMVQETLTSYGMLAPKTAHAEMTALLNAFARNSLAMNNYSLRNSEQSVVFFRASETPEYFSKAWATWAGGGVHIHLVSGDHYTMLRRPNVHTIAEILQRHLSANSCNESRTKSQKLSLP